jgi:Putative NADP-dependent oxidoreductases
MGFVDDALGLDKAPDDQRFYCQRFRRAPCDFLRDMSQWLREGKVKHREFVTEGWTAPPAHSWGY